MSTRSTPSPTASALNLDSPLIRQPDPDPRTTSSQIDRPSDDKRQSISHEPAEGGSSEARSMKASSSGGLKSVDGNGGRLVEQAPLVSLNTKRAVPSPTNTPAASFQYTAHTGGQQNEQDNTPVVAAPVLPSDTETAPPGTTNTTPTPSHRPQNMTGQDELASALSSGGVPAHPSATQAPMTSLSDPTPQDGWKELVDIQRQMLDVLTKMNKKLDGQDEEEDDRPIEGGASAQPHKDPFKQTFFGIPRQRLDRGQQFNPMNEDYEAIFPEDPYGEEAGPNARVFRVYNEEAAVYDADMIGQCSDSSDVLLVFAGLFSAVLTTFVAQTSQALDPDTGAISNSLLLEVVHLLRAQGDGTSFGEVEPAITETTPTGNDLWVNGLWFTSLTLSLSTALFAVLTKQWLRQYMKKMSGTARDRSITRQFRFAGMVKWHVVTIIGILPVLLHLALGVFLAGLVIFLFPRSLPLACVVMGITVLIYSLYFVSNLVPVFNAQCPYRTPFSDILNILCHLHLLILNRLIVVLDFICAHLHPVLPFIPHETPFQFQNGFTLLGTHELDQVRSQSGSLSLNVIEWLIATSSNPSVLAVGVEAISGLPPSQREDILKLEELYLDVVCDLIKNCLKFSDTEKGPSCHSGYTGKLGRLCRTFPLLQESWSMGMYLPWDIYPIFYDLGDVQGMVAALGVYSNEGKDRSTILTHLFDSSKSPKATLSPFAWATLFQNLGNVEPVHRLEICKQVLESGNTASEIQAWEDSMEPVPISYVLNRGPEGQCVVLSAFRDYDTFRNLDFISQSPDSPQLRALLAMHHFLESSASDSSKSLLLSLWEHIHKELNQNSTANDCIAVFHTATECLPQWHQHEWILSENMSKYCYALLSACDKTLFYAPSALQGIQWNCAEWVAEIAFPTGGPSEDYIISTCEMAGQLWRRALVRDIEGAYTSFIKFQVLGYQPSAVKHFPCLVPNFISGLFRQLGHPSPHPDWFMECKSYLYEPHNLLMACKILAEHRYSYAMYYELVQIDPDNEAWEGCREKLRQWCLNNKDRLSDLKGSLNKLEKIFEAQHQQKECPNRASFFRSIFGRHRNASAPSPSTDVEMGFVTTFQAANDKLATSQEIDNPEVPVSGNSVMELGGEVGGSVQPPNKEDIERSSSRGSETGISPAQEESSSSYHRARVSLSDIGQDEHDRETLRRGIDELVQDDENDNAREL